MERLVDAIPYRDGTADRKAWIDPRVLAEFRPRSRADGAPLPPIAGATLLADGTTRLWLLPPDKSSVEESARLNAAGEGAYSPVFRNGPSSTEPPRAAAPGIVVQLPAATDQAGADRFAAEQGLGAAKPSPLGAGWFVFETAAGVPALEAANRVLASGLALQAWPNWWRPVHPR